MSITIVHYLGIHVNFNMYYDRSYDFLISLSRNLLYVVFPERTRMRYQCIIRSDRPAVQESRLRTSC